MGKNYCYLCPYFFEEECFFEEFTKNGKTYIFLGYLEEKGKDYLTVLQNLKKHLKEKIRGTDLDSLKVMMTVFIPSEISIKDLEDAMGFIVKSFPDNTEIGSKIFLAEREEWVFTLVCWVKVKKKGIHYL